ncbi:DUF5666 domain-containing protein [Ramlibacter sp. PS3R-8]|uniref:DUF5666 domain-containing protein n=1 Tax=Ramlibacter sp. PS3R-8 TaxID=3133437 RepID=UPI0030B4A70B
MSKLSASSAAPLLQRRRLLVTLLAGAGVIVLPACGGGGGGVAGVDTGGTGSFSAGRISGFGTGSVIVNGVRYQDGAARITNADDATALQPRDLKLGMVVRIRAGATSAGGAGNPPTATATEITVETQVKGPVASKTAPDTLVVLGQTVKVDAATVFAGTTFAAIAVGDLLEVSGFANAAGVITASRIESEDATSEFRVRGAISNLDTAAKTFTVGTASFDYSGAGVRLPSTALANGLFVRVRTRPAQNADGAWIVTRIDLRENEVEDSDEAKVEGILVQNGSVLSVNGIRIDTSRLPAGTALPVGLQVEVEGEIVDGVLFANAIEVEDEDEEAEVDVRGEVSALDTGARTFVVRDVTFHYTPGATEEKDGTFAADLRNGATVRVRGTLPAGGAGNVEASEVDFRI